VADGLPEMVSIPKSELERLRLYEKSCKELGIDPYVWWPKCTQDLYLRTMCLMKNLGRLEWLFGELQKELDDAKLELHWVCESQVDKEGKNGKDSSGK